MTGAKAKHQAVLKKLEGARLDLVIEIVVVRFLRIRKICCEHGVAVFKRNVLAAGCHRIKAGLALRHAAGVLA